MLARQKIIDVYYIALFLAVSSLALVLSACEQSQPSPQQRALLIEKLEVAKKADIENAADSKADSGQILDSIHQAKKAQRVIQLLQQGEEVSQPEIDDALDVPSGPLSAEARTELIKELKTAEERDKLGEQTHDPAEDWLGWDSYREQRHRAEKVLQALEIGQHVPWSEIQQALQVPELQ
jgi:hypothetical protein